MKKVLCAVSVILTVAPVAFGQIKDDKPIKTTLCRLVKTPEQFVGKLVQIRATIRAGIEANDDTSPIYEASLLSDLTCSATVWFAQPGMMGRQSTPADTSIAARQDDNYRKMIDFLGRQYEPTSGTTAIVCINCPLFSVTATVIGRFEHIQKEPERSAHGVVGFGPLKAYDSQIVLQSVSEVMATPVDRSIYEKRKYDPILPVRPLTRHRDFWRVNEFVLP
jgi:hypothetical protein